MNNSIRIEENKYLVLPKLKRIKLKYHREIPKNYRIKSVTLTNSNGNYYVSILTEFEKEIQKIPSSDKVMGLIFQCLNYLSVLKTKGLIIQDILGCWRKNYKNYKNPYQGK